MKIIKGYLRNLYKNRRYLLILYLVLAIVIGSQVNLTSVILNLRAAIIVLLIVLTGTIFIGLIGLNIKLEVLGAILVLIFGVFNSILTPIVDVPDEITHLIRAEITSNGNLFPQPVDGINFETKENLLHISSEAKQLILDLQNDPAISNETGCINRIAATNSFVAYIPPAIGIIIAKILHTSEIGLLVVVRLIHTIFATFLTWLALKIAPKFKLPLLIAACFPIAVYLAGSASIDTTIDYISLVIIAYFIRLLCKEDFSISYREVIIMFLLCLVLGLSKITMAIFSCFLLCIPFKKYKNKLVYASSFGAIFIILFCVLVNYIYGLTLPDYFIAFKLENNINSAQQIQFMIDHTKLSIAIIINNLFRLNPESFFNLGQLDYTSIFGAYYFVFLGGFLLTTYKNELKLELWQKIGLGLIFILPYIASYIIFYITYSPVGSYDVWGIQMRYFIPLITLIPLIFTNRVIEIDSYEIKVLNFYILSCLILLIIVLLSTVIRFYV